MSQSAVTFIVLALAPALALSGCIENMGDLKEALGVEEPLVAAATYAPPLAAIDLATMPALMGAPVRFSGEESQDPQDMTLLFSWDFGDGSLGAGATASHVYAATGTYLVKLVVTNEAGLADEDTLALTVAALDRAPTVGIRAPARGIIGEPMAFEALASDPEGTPLAIEWAFGDGSSGQDAAASHAYEKPGVYDVRVSATDTGGNVARSSVRVVVDGAWHAEGAFAPAGAQTEKLAFPVVAGARSLEIVLSFEEGPAGINDLEIVVLDASGEEIARSDGGLGSAPERSVVVDEDDLSAGTWTARVVLETGVSAAWTLDVIESLD